MWQILLSLSNYYWLYPSHKAVRIEDTNETAFPLQEMHTFHLLRSFRFRKLHKILRNVGEPKESPHLSDASVLQYLLTIPLPLPKGGGGEPTIPKGFSSITFEQNNLETSKFA